MKKGRPPKVRSPIVDRNNPDNYPTLIRYLEATGRIQHTTYAQMYQARNMYLRCVSVEIIAVTLKVEPAVVDRWALCFSWDEERDRRLFEQFRKVSGVSGLFTEDIGKRHERIAGGMEQIAERLLQQHQNGKITLSTQDLNRLAAMLKSTQDIRRTARGIEAEKKDKKGTTIHVDNVTILDKLAVALVDSTDRPKQIAMKSQTIAVGAEEGIGHDTEYETIDWNSVKGEESQSEDRGS